MSHSHSLSLGYDPYAKDYSNHNLRKAFKKLPIEDQLAVEVVHWDVALKMEGVMRGPKVIEIAGYKILAMPLESMALTSEQSKKFTTEVGGFEIDCSKMSINEQMQFAKDHPEVAIDWQESFENLQAEITGTLYHGFDLFKKVYEAFPDIASMTKEEATEVGLYPTIHYRNFLARKWLAEMIGGHLATLDENYEGELHDICDAAEEKTNLQRLAAMGQAPLGWRNAYVTKVYDFGHWTRLGSGSDNADGNVRALSARRGRDDVRYDWYGWRDAVSSIVILDN